MTLAPILGDQKLVAVDVGSRGGLLDHWKRFSRHFEAYGFDADAAAVTQDTKAERGAVRYYPYAIGAREGRAKFYVTRRPSGSSFYEPNLELAEELGVLTDQKVDRVVELETITLDQFARKAGLSRVDAIKLDVQGGELDVLRGAETSLAHVLAIETEVEFWELYRGQPLFWDVHAFLARRGFELFDLRTTRAYKARQGRINAYLREHFQADSFSPHISARLIAGDALYFRRSLPESKAFPRSDDAAMRRLAALYCVYGYLDVAMAAVEDLLERGALSPVQAPEAVRAIRGLAPPPGLFEGNRFFSQALRRIGRRFGWQDRQVFWTKRTPPDQ